MSKHVAVIGGGFTGMVAALRLAQAGDQVDLYERGPQLGGLAAGFPLFGTHLELAYHHLFKSDTHIIALAQELGVASQLRWQPSSVAVLTPTRILPFASPLDLLRFPLLSLADRIRLGAVIAYLQRQKNFKRFEKVTAAAWLRRACGQRAYEAVWQPLLQGKFHQYAEQVSMAWLWARVHIRARSRSSLGGREELGYFQGGFTVVVQALEARLRDHGVRIHTQQELRGLHSTPDRRVSLQSDAGAAVYDAAIATVPSRIFSKLIAGDPRVTPEYHAQLNAMPYLGALCLAFTSPQSLSRYYWHNVHAAASPFLVFLQHTNLVPPGWYQGQHVYYLGAYLPHEHEFFGLAPEEIQERFFAHLHKLLPAFDPQRVTSVRVSKLPYAQHVVGVDYARLRPAVQTPLPNVYLSNFSQIFPEDRGTNAAVREGERVAAQLRS